LVFIYDANLIYCNYFDGIYGAVLRQINCLFNFKKSVVLTAMNTLLLVCHGTTG